MNQERHNDAPAKAPGPSTYDPAYFARLAEIEDRHFWFRTRNRVISALARQAAARFKPGHRVLEIGCGTGNVLRFLEKACPRGQLFGMDLFAEGLAFARRRVSCPLIRGDIRHTPFRVPFEIIGMFDVLEHLPDDARVLKDVLAMLKPGGVLLLTVPAHASLWSYFDEASHHCRRYEPAELRERLEEAGYRVEFLTQYMASIYPLVWLRRKVLKGGEKPAEAGKGRDELSLEELRINPWLNGPLAAILGIESRLVARRWRLPVGTSILAVASRVDPQSYTKTPVTDE